ncbi:hypothetical protein EJ08DRAFT_662880 [Tothia fuscella]|uniref:Uncharacterized protein n=1 Tax=Tothia fuscella TaxID=1048955 RepID=A0A9P4NLY1_9PEZI|nr:hypothetical protein EJ08DRAFT_662880 [Tothia fuscella]
MRKDKDSYLPGLSYGENLAMQYGGRFFHGVADVGEHENSFLGKTAEEVIVEDIVPFSFETGGYAVELNQGTLDKFPPADATITAFRASKHSEHFYRQSPPLRILETKFSRIIDAIDPGGSGNPYAGLNPEERDALVKLTKMGFPMAAWFRHQKIAQSDARVFPSLLDILVRWDPTYFDADFGTKPGYLGFDGPDSLLKSWTQHNTTIKRIICTKEALALGMPISVLGNLTRTDNDLPVAVILQSLPDGEVRNSALRFYSGSLDQFRVRGQPIYPVRESLLNFGPTVLGTGTDQSGKFTGKVVVVQAHMDETAFPWQTVSYIPAIQQALREVSMWVELGIPPLPTTNYTVIGDQVILAKTAEERKSLQPVVTLTANEKQRVDVKVREGVSFLSSLDVPPGARQVVSLEFDFEDYGDYIVSIPVTTSSGSQSSATANVVYSFNRPGTYFPAFRGASQQHYPLTPSDLPSSFGKVQNLGRVRVVVT